ncbi:MAG: FAD-dependent tricarballylate dehydrogenase TcuA [Bacteroidetes bacterium]|jgi:tricarballylate dehydrogenase|nr:FAD-dependent tricarballylate dehydrogenase TcuA [Bacteroidota bacterium]
MTKVVVVGSGNAALCAGIAALEKGAEVLIVEKANEQETGGNSRYTAGAMRFVYNSNEDLLPLLLNPNDERIPNTDFGSYPKEKFQKDLLGFNDGRPLSLHQNILINKSYETLEWLGEHNVKFEPIYSRQTFQKDGKYIFWGGLTLEAKGEGVGLIEAEMEEFKRLGGMIMYETAGKDLIVKDGGIEGIICDTLDGEIEIEADSVILGCGGFEANPDLRKKYMGEKWVNAKVRGTRHNMGRGIEMALEIGAQFHGVPDGCHATPMDLNMPNYGNPEIPYIERKHYRKICYFLGVMLNANGDRFEDEGVNFRNYTYAQFGRSLLNQPGGFAWQIFDKKVEHLLYSEYRFWDASFVKANTLEELVEKLEGVDSEKALKTLNEYNNAVDAETSFDPTVLDGKSTTGLSPNKTNWANKFDTPPFKAFPVTCGITFTYGGLKVDENAAVLNEKDEQIEGLFACGELVGGVFYNGYPGGSGLTSGAVFGRLAGYSAAQ